MSKNKKTFFSSALFIVILLIFSFSLLLAPQTAYGQEAHDWNSWEIIPSECLGDAADCNLNSFVNLFVNLSYILLKILPYVAMLMMIMVGFNFISAGGNPEKIQSSKKMLYSVFLGIIIIIALAWCYSYFIVYALTCNPDKEESCTGKIFQGYPSVWEKEWWGGGEPMQYPIGSGCCVVNGVGCKEMTREACQDVKNLFPSSDPQFMGDNQFCDQYISTCKNYTIPGCCISLAVGGSCGYPGSNGCLDYNDTQYTSTPCQNLGTCLEILGEPPEESETGCCITSNSCDMSSYQSCSGGFQVGTNCGNIEECNTGCCIGQTSCENNKINCDGIWKTTDCSVHTLDCATGCCETISNCTNDTTRGYCESLDDENFTEGAPCLTGCIGGCCQGNCTDNKIDGNCPWTEATLRYVDNDCNSVGACTNGCCRFNNTTQCTNDVSQGDCDGQFWAGFTCDAIDICDLGCCYDPSGNYNCYQSVASAYCSFDVIGGIFDVTADCSGLNECDTGPGCCVIDGGSPNYNCQNLTSTQTRAYCENVLGGLFNQGVTCENDPPYSGICFP